MKTEVATPGLRLGLSPSGAVTRVQAGNLHIEARAGATGGLWVREAPNGKMLTAGLAAGRDCTTALPEVGLSVTARVEEQPTCVRVTGMVEDARANKDRAVDVVFRLPFTPALWWARISEVVMLKDKAADRPLPEDKLPPGAAVLEATEQGALAQNVLPIGCVTDPQQRAGVAIAIPPNLPCQFRFAYVPETGCLELTLPFGFSPAAAPEIKSRAPFQFIIVPVDGKWGIRDAFRQYYALFPKSFERRTRSSGLWLFNVQSFDKAPDPQSYAFWEGPILKQLDQAQAHGIETYPYIIVGQREITHLKEKPAGYEGIAAVLQEEPTRTARSGWKWAEVKALVESCGLFDPQGRWIYQWRDTEWGGNSVTFPLNPSPFLPASPEHPTVASTTLAEVEQTLREYPTLSGIYVDSLASWGSFNNYRREHFAVARTPLSHDEAGRVFIPNWMPHVDFLNELRHRIGNRLVFGNGIRPGRAFCAFACDILGVETGEGDLAHRRNLDFYRAVCGAKPFLFLFYYPKGEMPRAIVEEYVQRFVAMGLSPEVTGTPWGRNKGRDADLYARFLPIYRRLDLAGWQPVTHASASPPTVWVERFGAAPPELYFTLYNPGDQKVSAPLAVDWDSLHLSPSTPMSELVEGEPSIGVHNGLAIPPRSLRVVRIGS